MCCYYVALVSWTNIYVKLLSKNRGGIQKRIRKLGFDPRSRYQDPKLLTRSYRSLSKLQYHAGAIWANQSTVNCGQFNLIQLIYFFTSIHTLLDCVIHHTAVYIECGAMPSRAIAR